MTDYQKSTNIDNTLNEDEIDIKPTLNTLYREKKFLISIPLLTSIIIAIISLFETQVWRGNFQIVISDSNKQSNSLGNLGINVKQILGIRGSGGDLDIKTQEIILKSPSVLNPVYQYVMDNKKYTDKYTYSDWLNGSLGLKVETGSNVINISYKDADKEFIINVLKKISLEYKKYSTSDAEIGISKQIKYLESQNKLMSEASKKSIKELKQFQIENGLGPLNGLGGLNDQNSYINQNLEEPSKIGKNNSNTKSQRFNAQFLLLEEYEAEYSKYLAILKPESELLKDLKVKIDNMRSLLKRPNEILIKQNELQRIALRDEVILNKIENELILLKLEQSKEQQPWKIISEPTIEKQRVSPKRTQKTILSFIFSFFVTAIILIFKEKKTNIVFEENELMQKIKCRYIDTLYKGNQLLNDQLISNLKNNYEFDLILSSNLMNKDTKLISKNNKISYKKLDECCNSTNTKKFFLIVERGKILKSDISSINRYSNAFQDQLLGWLLLE